MGRGVRFVGPLSTSDTSIDLKVAYRRFYFDGVASGKLEIGFKIRAWNSQFQMAQIISQVLELPISINKHVRQLGACGADFARAYVRATTPHHLSSDDTNRLVLAGRPCVIVEKVGMKPGTPRHAIDLPHYEKDGIGVYFWHQRKFAVDIPVWLLHRLKGTRIDPQSRALRLYISRFHANTEALFKTLRSIAIGLVQPTIGSESSERMQYFLYDAFRHQRKLGAKMDAALSIPFYQGALWYRDHALPGHYDALLNRIEIINPRPSIEKQVRQFVKDREAQDKSANLIVLGDYVVTKNDVRNSGNAGVVGVSVGVTESSINVSQTALGSTPSNAVAELKELAKVLSERATSPEEEVGAIAVANAATKLEKGDESSALAWLKRSGAWALAVAEECSIKLAAELIIRAST